MKGRERQNERNDLSAKSLERWMDGCLNVWKTDISLLMKNWEIRGEHLSPRRYFICRGEASFDREPDLGWRNILKQLNEVRMYE